MKQDNNKKQERVRKTYAPAGTITQKMMSFKLDLDNVEWLNRQTNKGRYINNLIKADRQQQHTLEAQPAPE